MVKYLDRIRVSNNDAVVSAIHEDDTVEVVYKNSGKDVYEDARLAEGKWAFVHEGVVAGYARGKRRLNEAVQKLNMSPELRSRLERPGK